MLKRLLLLGVLTVAPPAFAASQPGVCETAAAVAEARYRLPAGLLGAIGVVESGRDGLAWPWTINAAGAGQQFDSRDAGLERVRVLQSQGVASIDVGCFQINLFHHPQAFDTLEQAFEPAANADYAARFLQQLATRLGSWEAAVAAYHSATPALGEAYRARVYAALGPGSPVSDLPPSGSPASAPPPAAGGSVCTRFGSHVMTVWTPVRPGTTPAIIAVAASLQEHCRS